MSKQRFPVVFVLLHKVHCPNRPWLHRTDGAAPACGAAGLLPRERRDRHSAPAVGETLTATRILANPVTVTALYSNVPY